jgi:hypothetical protein
LALQPTNSAEDVFVREVDEELQKDQMLGIWKQWGRWIVGGISFIVLAWGGFLYWQFKQAEAAGIQGENYTRLMDTLEAGSDVGVAMKLAEIEKSTDGGYKAPAALTRGGIAVSKNDVKAAVAAFKSVIDDPDAPQVWRDLALIRQTAAEFDTMKPEAVIARLKPISVAGNPWFGSAGEMTAMAYLRMNKPDLAGRIFADLAKNETVPETIRSRSAELANALGVEAATPLIKEGTR